MRSSARCTEMSPVEAAVEQPDARSGAAASVRGGGSGGGGRIAPDPRTRIRSSLALSARTAVPVHQPPGGIREAAVVNTRRQRALPAQDAVPGRHHARHFRTIGFHCKAGRPGTEAQSQPNPLPRGVRTQQSAPGVGHAGKTGQGQQGQGG